MVRFVITLPKQPLLSECVILRSRSIVGCPSLIPWPRIHCLHVWTTLWCYHMPSSTNRWLTLFHEPSWVTFFFSHLTATCHQLHFMETTTRNQSLSLQEIVVRLYIAANTRDVTHAIFLSLPIATNKLMQIVWLQHQQSMSHKNYDAALQQVNWDWP